MFCQDYPLQLIRLRLFQHWWQRVYFDFLPVLVGDLQVNRFGVPGGADLNFLVQILSIQLPALHRLMIPSVQTICHHEHSSQMFARPFGLPGA
jgi:hypothetical protein